MKANIYPILTAIKLANTVYMNALDEINNDKKIANRAITSSIGLLILSKIFHLDNIDNLDLGFNNHLIICISPLYHLWFLFIYAI